MDGKHEIMIVLHQYVAWDVCEREQPKRCIHSYAIGEFARRLRIIAVYGHRMRVSVKYVHGIKWHLFRHFYRSIEIYSILVILFLLLLCWIVFVFIDKYTHIGVGNNHHGNIKDVYTKAHASSYHNILIINIQEVRWNDFSWTNRRQMWPLFCIIILTNNNPNRPKMNNITTQSNLIS